MEASTITVHWHNETKPVYSVQYQPNGPRVVTAGGDNNLRVWQVTDGKKNDDATDVPDGAPVPVTPLEVAYWLTLAKHTQAVNVARFNLKGDILASGGDDGKIFLWKLAPPGTKPEMGTAEADDDAVEQWQVVGTVRDSSKEVTDLCWSPCDNYIVAGTQDNMAVVYHIIADGDRLRGTKVAQTGEEDHTHFVQGVAWDPLNLFIATQAADKSVNIYYWTENPPQLQLAKRHASHDGKQMYYSEELNTFFRRLTWSPDGAYLLSPAGKVDGDDSIPCVYVFARNHLESPVWLLRGLTKPAVAILFSPIKYRVRSSLTMSKLPYYYLFAVATQDLIIVYTTETFEPIALATNLHYSSICDLAWCPDGRRIMVLSADGFCSSVTMKPELYTGRQRYQE